MTLFTKCSWDALVLVSRVPCWCVIPILRTPLCGKSHIQFADEETGLVRQRGWPKVTQLIMAGLGFESRQWHAQPLQHTTLLQNPQWLPTAHEVQRHVH